MSLPTPEHPDDSTRNTDAPYAQPLSHRRSPAPSDESDTEPRLWPARLAIGAGVLAFLLILITLTSAIALRHAMHASLPQLDGSLPVAGLSAPVTVTRDAQGVPSIRAANLDDLLFAQGYITASDRLFQMDALRRHAAGELAELLGPSLIDHDREQRILQLRSAADRAIAVLPADQLHQLQAYSNGVNAFIDTHSGHKPSPSAQDLPVEFHILRYTPAPWTPRDSLLVALVMSQNLSTEFPTKLNREALAAHLPAALLPDLYPSGSWRDHPPTQTPTDLTTPTDPVEQIPLDKTQSSLAPDNPTLVVRAGPLVIRAGPLAVRAGPGCPTHDVASSHEWAGNNPTCPTPEPQTSHVQLATNATPHDLLAVNADLHSHLCEGCLPGSNNWAVAGTHTANGAPLLSNDMHLGLTAPDIWYEAGLHAATSPAGTPFSVTGFTLPGVPFVIVGRNPFVAWGFTNSGADVQDVLIEHLRGSGSGTEYEHPDGTWSPIGHQIEHIHVRAGRDVTLDVLTTTHTIGATTITTPIISPLYKSEHRALALAWTIYDPSTITSPMYAINTATDAASLVAACASFGSVSQNLVYADAHHIGYHLLGRIPIRGPATQRPRVVQPFILPDTTPSEDEDDESGDSTTASLNPSSWPQFAGRSQEIYAPALPSPATTLSSRPESALFADAAERPAVVPASFTPNSSSRHHRPATATTQPSPSAQYVSLSAAQRRRRTPKRRTAPIPTTPSAPSTTQLSPSAQDPSAQDPYTIGSPISSVPIDALDPTQIWSGYIPYDALPSVLDPASGIIATANARVVTDDYPYFIANNWVDAYRVERINHLLTSDIASHANLTPADMLAIQTDTHSEFDLLTAQRLAYALDHSPLTQKDPRLRQAANLLRDWTGDVSPNSAAAAIVASTRNVLWPMLLIPKLRAHDHHRISGPEIDDLIGLYSWDEKTTALEQILQHTPARWLPHNFPNWDSFLTTAVQRGLKLDHAPANLTPWTYGALHPVDIAHPIFGSHSPISTLLGVATGSGFHPNGGDGTTIKQTGLHFGPSERFTADLSNPDNTHANITTGESGNPSSPWFLDQFLPWLNGTTYTLPLDHPTPTHTLTLTPQ